MDDSLHEEDVVELASPKSEGHTVGVVDDAHGTSPTPASPTHPLNPRYPQNFTPDEVLALTKPTDGFLCPLSANTYGFDFLDFEIKDYDSNESIFKVSKDPDATDLPDDAAMDLTFCENPSLEPSIRTVKYTFPKRMLKCNQIRTALTFSIGNESASDFRLIERHYFRNTLLKSYDFTFGFVIPNSTNGWDAIYNRLDPELLTPELEKEMIGNPFETTSDSFYFVGVTLVMHNKAVYQYI